MGEERESKELTIEASVENLTVVNDFVGELLDRLGCSVKIQMQLEMAVEEFFVNIANYAYTPLTGMVTIRRSVVENPLGVVLSFEDSGVPYNPLDKADPDVSRPIEEREIGGLGVFLAKKTVDDVRYEYRDGKNILTIRKNLSEP